MKLSSPRTWLVVAAGLLLIAGGVVVYVIKNPPLPPGWTVYECEYYRAAVPPGRGDGELIRAGSYFYFHMITPLVDFSIKSVDVTWNRDTPDEMLDAYLEDKLTNQGRVEVHRMECLRLHGHPARILSFTMTTEGGNVLSRKRLVVAAKGWLHDVCTDIVPGILTEADADFLFRSFCPK